MPREPIALIEEQGTLTSTDTWKYVHSDEGDDEITLDGAFTVEDLIHIIARKVGSKEKLTELCGLYDN